MKFSEILQHLKEQIQDDQDPRDDEENDINNIEEPDNENPEDGEPEDGEPENPENIDNLPEPQDVGNIEDEEEPDEIPERRVQPNANDIRSHQQQIRNKLSALDRLKERWRTEADELNQDITEEDFSNIFDFFDRIKNNLRPLTGSENDNPQLFALKRKYPDFPADNKQKIKDIQNYSWEQISFFKERYIENVVDEDEEITYQEEDVKIVTAQQFEFLNQQLDAAVKMFEERAGKLYDNGTVIVRDIISENLSITYGQIQHYLRRKHYPNVHGSNELWCTTRVGGMNYYNTYRDTATQFYILNKNVPENHLYRFFSIRAFKQGRPEYPYQLTNVLNDDNDTGLSLDEIIRRTNCPELRNIQDKLAYYPKGKINSQEAVFQSYTFDGRNPSTDFAFLSPHTQLLYISQGRKIKSGKVLKSLGISEIIRNGESTSYDLQKEYIGRVEVNNYLYKFTTEDQTEEPFEMITSLRRASKSFLNSRLQNLGITDGIYGLLLSIMKKTLRQSFREVKRKNLGLYEGRNHLNLFGVFDSEAFKWIKPLKYTKQVDGLFMNPDDKLIYVVNKYVSDDDYFYWIFTQKNRIMRFEDRERTIKNPDYLKGQFYNGDEGDELVNNWRRI